MKVSFSRKAGLRAKHTPTKRWNRGHYR